MRARADRPQERRGAPEPGQAAGRLTVRVAGLQLRSSSAASTLQFEGMASVTNSPYQMWDFFGEYEEEVASGAFLQTLKRDGLDVPLVLEHDSMRRIARTTNGSLQLSETDNGLHVLADLDPEDLDVQYIAPKLRSGLIDEMSFKFRINQGEWSPDWSLFRIQEVDIHRGDVAIVSYGANPATAGSGLRSLTVPKKSGAQLIHPDELKPRR
jgi:HK97 family phage prohead protease